MNYLSIVVTLFADIRDNMLVLKKKTKHGKLKGFSENLVKLT